MSAVMYGGAVDRYRSAGWPNVLPLPASKKKSPPIGFTGDDGATPDDDTYREWRTSRSGGNVALRLPAFVVGLDADLYKPAGATSWAAFVANLSPLPSTWRSTSRVDGSGIRLYRVPAGVRFRGAPAPGIEVVQHHHRYAVVPPSVHPEGNPYRWIDDEGEVFDDYPIVGRLPELPADWVDALRIDAPEPAWLAALTGSAPGAAVPPRVPLSPASGSSAGPRVAELVLADAKARVAAGASRHDTTVVAAARLYVQADAGNPGAHDALEELGRAFREWIADRSTPKEADREWADIVTSAARKFGGRLTPYDPGHGRPGGSITGTGEAAPLLPANLPASLWEARPWLAHVRQAAHARGRAADAVLAAVLARVAAMTPHTYAIEPIVGGLGSLNFYALVIGPSGAGKSSAVSVARELVPTTVARARGVRSFVDDRPLGSGEGLAELYMGEVLEESEAGKKVKVRRQVAFNAWAYVDEGESLVAQIERKGTTVMEALRRGWTGAALGQSNASADRTRVIPEGAYRLALVAGFQPEKVARLLDDAQGGTPQRFVWASALDPTVPADPPAWPGPLEWPAVAPADLTDSATEVAGYMRNVLRVGPRIAAEVRAANLARVRGQAADAGLDAHADLHKLKLAALLAVLDGRLTIADDDWHLAGVIWSTSVRVRTWCIDQVAADAVVVETARTEAHARRELAAEAARQSAPDRVQRLAARLARWVHAQGEEPVGRKGLRARLAGDERALLDPALAEAVASGWLTEAEGRWARGESQPAG